MSGGGNCSVHKSVRVFVRSGVTQFSGLTCSSVDLRMFLALLHDSRAWMCLRATLPPSLMPLPGHEGLQHGDVVLGEVVLTHNVLQGLQMTRYHTYRLHLVLTLEESQHY